jgi:hypothetical protein
MIEKLRKGYSITNEYHFDFDRYFAENYDACMANRIDSHSHDLEMLRVFIENEFEEYLLYKIHIYPEVNQLKFYKHKTLNIFVSIDINSSSFYYESSLEAVTYLQAIFLAVRIQKKKEEAEIYTLLQGSSGLIAHKTLFKAPVIDIDAHYNDDFVDQYNKVCGLIDDNDTGLVLWHGAPGVGKTSVLRHLMTKGFNRKFLFIPSGYAEMLGEPGFNNLLIQPEYKGCVLVIEDAESLIKKTQERSAGMSNILNLTDGLMKDVFGCLIIATFNVHIAAIDQALVRGGRLKARYEFKKLSLEKVFAINEIAEEMTLAEIFHSTETIEEEKVIGFKTK